MKAFDFIGQQSGQTIKVKAYEELSKKKVVSVRFGSYFEVQLHEIVLGPSRCDFPQQ